MKFFPLFFCFVLLFAVAVAAQSNQNSNCPTVVVFGGEVIEPGKSMIFTVSVKDFDLEKISFHWSLSEGK